MALLDSIKNPNLRCELEATDIFFWKLHGTDLRKSFQNIQKVTDGRFESFD